MKRNLQKVSDTAMMERNVKSFTIQAHFSTEASNAHCRQACQFYHIFWLQIQVSALIGDIQVFPVIRQVCKSPLIHVRNAVWGLNIKNCTLFTFSFVFLLSKIWIPPTGAPWLMTPWYEAVQEVWDLMAKSLDYTQIYSNFLLIG